MPDGPRCAACRTPPRLRTSDLAILDRARAMTEPDARIVDWSCGSRRVLQALRRRCRDAVGVDVVPGLVERLDLAGLPAARVDESMVAVGAPRRGWKGSR